MSKTYLFITSRIFCLRILQIIIEWKIYEIFSENCSSLIEVQKFYYIFTKLRAAYTKIHIVSVMFGCLNSHPAM